MTFRRSLLLFTACTSVCLTPSARDALAAGPGENTAPQTIDTTQPSPSGSLSDNVTNTQDIVVRRKQLLLKQKDVPSGVTEVTKDDIKAAGNQSNIYSLLQQTAPNVNVYAQGPGQNAPIFSVRGVRGNDLAATLDGIPMQDLLFGGQGAFLQNTLGYYFDREQIDSVSVFPGVAAPGSQGYGSIGGTLAYESKKPTDDRSFELFGSYGSFNTSEFGFTANTGKMPDLGDLKIMLQYSQLETSGYIDYTPAKYRDTMLAFSKPWMDGSSTVSGYIIYNNANGYLQSQPTPTVFGRAYGDFSNFDPSTTFFRNENDYLNIKLSDETFLANDVVKLSGSVFYLRSNSTSYSYQNPQTIVEPAAGSSYYLFTQVPFNFYGGGGPNGVFGPGNRRYNANFFAYDPSIYGNSTDQNCPCGYGLNSETVRNSNQTYGVTPRINIFVPTYAGVTNTITVGALVAEELQQGDTYFGATPSFALIPGYNSFAIGNQQRTIYQGYVQDKIDLFNNKVHIEPGFTYEGAFASNHQLFSYSGIARAADPSGNGQYELKRWDREILPYVGASVDLPYNFKIFGSYGRSALFAPVSNFTIGSNTAGNTRGASTTLAPSAALQDAFEGGIRYDTDQATVTLDYFYQKTRRAFGFFTNYLIDQSQYGNTGIEEFKGFEAAGKYRVTPEFTVFGSAGYVLAKYLQSYDAFTTIGLEQFGHAFKGDPISGVPDWTASFGFDYNRPNAFQPEDNVFFRLYGTYTGSQYTTIDLGGDPSSALYAATVTNRQYKLNPWTLLNFELDYKLPIHSQYLKSLTLELNGQNITNLHYSAYYYNQFTSFAGDYSRGGVPFDNALAGPPAALTATVRARF